MDSFSAITKSIGGYFTLVSLLPSLMLVAALAALIASGAPMNRPSVGAARNALDGATFRDWTALFAFALFAALVFHPLQFAIVQFYEGYWGTSKLALVLRSRGIETQIRDRRKLKETFEDASTLIESEVSLEAKRAAISARDESARLQANYPRELAHIMPTRFGNILRSYEVNAGARYGLDATRVLPHLALVAEPAHMSYLNDQRSLMDLSVRMSFTSYLICGSYLLALWPYDLWLLLAAGWAALGSMFYLGARTVAHHYGSAICILVDLNRFRLYQALHLKQPGGSTEERRTNLAVASLLEGNPKARISYEHSG
jgi:hypothetical protein